MRNGKTIKKSVTKVEQGSGNVFADLGLAEPDRLLAKAQLVRQIEVILKRHRITEKRAARILGMSTSRLSELLRGDLDLFPIDRLLHFLNALDHDVEIVIRPKRKGSTGGSTSVVPG